jgi:hypothetical protein
MVKPGSQILPANPHRDTASTRQREAAQAACHALDIDDEFTIGDGPRVILYGDSVRILQRLIRDGCVKRRTE